VFGDFEHIVQQVRNVYQTKNPRMRAYRNLIWDFIENLFLAFNIIVVSRELKQKVDSLDVASSTFKAPIIPQTKYEMEMRYKPSILDNVKHW
jgi:hypothetical protein